MTETSAKTAIKQPLLEFFHIEGLNDYKNITLNCEKKIKIISAENGSGKTTVMNALYALLTGKIGPLLSIKFKHFVIKFIGHPEIIISKADLFPQLTEDFSKNLSSLPIAREARTWGLTDAELQEMILLSAVGAETDFENCAGFRKLYEDTPYDDDYIKQMCKGLTRDYRVWTNRSNAGQN